MYEVFFIIIFFPFIAKKLKKKQKIFHHLEMYNFDKVFDNEMEKNTLVRNFL